MNVSRLHGMSDSIISDRDEKFASKFRADLMDCYGSKLKMSTSTQPQTDGSMKLMNRVVENYHCYYTFRQKNWTKPLSTAEFIILPRFDFQICPCLRLKLYDSPDHR